MTDFDSSLDWLDTVREGIAELTQHYGGRWRYDEICFGPCPTEEELTAREQELGIRLPEDYREFLKYIGNGGFGPGHGLRHFQVEELDRSQEPTSYEIGATPIEVEFSPRERIKKEKVSHPFPLVEPHYFTEVDWSDKSPETGYIEIADYGCTSFEILIVAGAEYGHVWGMDDGGVGPYEICYASRNDLLWEPLRPHRYTFKDWYLDWLQAMLNTVRQRGIS